MKIQDLYEGQSLKDKVSYQTMSELSDILRNNCKDVFKNFYSRGNVEKFRHATGKPFDSIYTVVSNKENRKPTDTPVYFHNIMDTELEDKFGVRFRSNSMFSFYMSYNRSYYTLFPYDGYKMISSGSVYDMFILVQDTFHDNIKVNSLIKSFIENFTNLPEEDKSKIKYIPNNLFSLLGEESWMKEDDFPNVDTFMTEFKYSVMRMLGSDVEITASKDDYAKLLQNVVTIVNQSLSRSAHSYNEVDTPKDINSESTRDYEVMIHSEKFVIVDTESILQYLIDMGHDYSENDVIKMLYEKDLTAFE